MNLNQTFLAELKQEAASTRQLLALVPFDKADYKPHEKSMTLGRLAQHVAEINGWWKETLLQDELDFAKDSGARVVLNSTDELVAYHDDLVAKAETILNEFPEQGFQDNWTMRQGDIIFFTLPKAAVARTWCFNHLYHHRAQLTVYLRMLDIALPATYATSYDTEHPA